jgi:hypothetical protein
LSGATSMLTTNRYFELIGMYASLALVAQRAAARRQQTLA